MSELGILVKSTGIVLVPTFFRSNRMKCGQTIGLELRFLRQSIQFFDIVCFGNIKTNHKRKGLPLSIQLKRLATTSNMAICTVAWAGGFINFDIVSD